MAAGGRLGRGRASALFADACDGALGDPPARAGEDGGDGGIAAEADAGQELNRAAHDIREARDGRRGLDGRADELGCRVGVMLPVVDGLGADTEDAGELVGGPAEEASDLEDLEALLWCIEGPPALGQLVEASGEDVDDAAHDDVLELGFSLAREGLERPQTIEGGERCGLCGKRGKLKRTECCGQPICDDASEYRMFSYARNSCSRNHSRFTLCALHDSEGHRGEWKTCRACRRYFDELELYAYYGTNEYNFEKLEKPPTYEPTHCGNCGRVIRLGKDGYEVGPEGYRCEGCFGD
jgi:hypothetical protein